MPPHRGQWQYAKDSLAPRRCDTLLWCSVPRYLLFQVLQERVRSAPRLQNANEPQLVAWISEHKSTRDTRVRGTEQQSCDCLCELSMERIFEGHNSETTDGAINGGHHLFEGAKRENFSTIEGLSKEVTGTFIRASTRSGKQKYWFIDVACHPREFIHRPSISWARCHRRWLLSGLWVM